MSLPWEQTYSPARSIPSAFKADTLSPPQDQPAVIKQSLQVREKRLMIFPADTAIPANANLLFQRGSGIPAGCTGFRFIKVQGNVNVSINGGGFRLVQDQDVVSGAEVMAVQIVTDSTGSAIFQPWGEGD